MLELIPSCAWRALVAAAAAGPGHDPPRHERYVGTPPHRRRPPAAPPAHPAAAVQSVRAHARPATPCDGRARAAWGRGADCGQKLNVSVIEANANILLTQLCASPSPACQRRFRFRAEGASQPPSPNYSQGYSCTAGDASLALLLLIVLYCQAPHSIQCLRAWYCHLTGERARVGCGD